MCLVTSSVTVPGGIAVAFAVTKFITSKRLAKMLMNPLFIVNVDMEVLLIIAEVNGVVLQRRESEGEGPPMV